MADDAAAAAEAHAHLARLSTGDVQGLLAESTGSQWLRVRKAIRDNEVDGASLVDHVATAAILRAFLREDLECEVTLFVAKQLRNKLLLRAAKARVDHTAPPLGPRTNTLAFGGAPITAVGGGHCAGGGGGGGEGGGGGGGGAQQARPAPDLPAPLVGGARAVADNTGRVALRVQFSRSGGTDQKRITVEVPDHATVATAKQCLLDRLALPLSTTLVLTHGGRELKDEHNDNPAAAGHAHAGGPRRQWAELSVVHAVALPADALLSMDNLRAHPAVAARVDCAADAAAQDGHHGHVWGRLVVRDAGAPLGNGSFGAVFGGSLCFGPRRTVAVAVKKFFMLENPNLYGLMDAAAVGQWVARELLPEINTLLRLSHDHLVRLRCVGLRSLYGVAFPAYVAMDACTEGAMDAWIRDGGVADVLVSVFLADFVDAMMYLHIDMRIIHRDLKPANIFVRSDPARDGRPALVVGDLGLAKEIEVAVATTRARASAMGTPMYFAPEVTGAQPHCSFASDVYSMSLVAVELVTGVCVYTQCGADAAAKARVVAQAQAKARRILAFAEDSWLTAEAADALLAACLHDDPAQRCTLKQIRRLCFPLEAAAAATPTAVAPAAAATGAAAAAAAVEQERAAREAAERAAAVAVAEQERTRLELKQLQQAHRAQGVAERRAAALAAVSKWTGRGVNLQVAELNLAGRNIGGRIPTEIGQLAQLKALYLGGNQLTGRIPIEIGQLAQLTNLNLCPNQLTGRIPTEIGQLAQLRGLGLQNNQLTGPIPTEIGQLAQLTVLGISSNQLTGRIPTEIGQLAQLTNLDLSWNQLSGPIPTEIGQLAQLERLDLDNNQLTGRIPREIGQLVQLTHLYLHGNQLTGPIPTEIGQLAQLTVLGLDYNQLTGPIPTEIGQLAQLERLDLDNNQLTGTGEFETFMKSKVPACSVYV